MYFTGLLAVDQLEKVDELPANLIANLVRVLGVKHVRKRGQEAVHEGIQRSAVRLEQEEQRAEHRAVLEEVVLQRQCSGEEGQHLREGDGTCVADNETRDSTAGVVLRVQAGRGGVLRDNEQGLESAEKLEVLWGEVDSGVLNEEAGGEGGVAEDLALIVTKGTVEEFKQLLGIWSD